MLKVYFTASASHNGELIPYYKKILDFIKKQSVNIVSGEQVTDKKLLNEDKKFTAEQIFSREQYNIGEADVIIAEASKPSLGVGSEIVYALSLDKPVLVLVMAGYEDKISPMVSGNPSENLYIEYYKKEGPGFWEQDKIHGIDFSSFTKKEHELGYSNLLHVPSKFLLCPGQTIHYQKMIDARPGDEWCMSSVDFTIERDGTLNGLVGWFSTELSQATILDTAPHLPRTHWAQTYFPYYPMKVKKGDVVHVDYQINESYEGSRLLEMIIRIGPHEINFIVT